MSAHDRQPRFFRGCACCAPPPALAADPISRRDVVTGGIALGLGVALAPGLGHRPAAAQAQAAKRSRIDVHHHFLAPSHREVLSRNRGGAAIPD